MQRIGREDEIEPSLARKAPELGMIVQVQDAAIQAGRTPHDVGKEARKQVREYKLRVIRNERQDLLGSSSQSATNLEDGYLSPAVEKEASGKLGRFSQSGGSFGHAAIGRVRVRTLRVVQVC